MTTVLVLGGSGFVGRAFAAAWVAGTRPTGTLGTRATGTLGTRASGTSADRADGGGTLRIPSRRPSRAKALGMLPGIELVAADVHDPATLRALMADCDAVVNLVAVLHGDAARFERVHVRLARHIAEACVAAGVPQLIHVSALGVPADPAQAASAPSLYLRSKAQGEQALRAVAQAAGGALSLQVLRPSVIFGADDRFINLFAAMQAVAPLVPLAGASARFQPVWVGDVAQALLHCVCQPVAGRVLECAGPQVFTLAELVALAGRLSGHPRPVLPLPEWAGRLQAALLGLLPGEPLMSADNLASMRVPNVASPGAAGLASIGARPAALVDVMAPRLASGTAWFDRLRSRAGR
jgi:NADH dehydrogenase